jgi:hypothetical protein
MSETKKEDKDERLSFHKKCRKYENIREKEKGGR